MQVAMERQWECGLKGREKPKITTLKQHIAAVVGLVESLTCATTPASAFVYNCKSVHKAALRAVRGEWPARAAHGWTEIMACVVALTVLTDYDNDKTPETDTFLGRVEQVHEFARKETEDLRRTVAEREERDASQQERSITAKTAPDIGNVAKWSSARNFFYNYWSSYALNECLKCLSSITDSYYKNESPTVKRSDVTKAMAKIPKSPWQKDDESHAESHARAKALMNGDLDDEWDLGPVSTEVQGLPADKVCTEPGTYGCLRDQAGPDNSSETEDEEMNVSGTQGSAVVQSSLGESSNASPSTADVAEQASKKRARKEEACTTHKEAIQDAKRNKFKMLRDAAVFATIAYGQALHSIEDAGPDESRNIAWASSEISWEVREKLPLCRPL